MEKVLLIMGSDSDLPVMEKAVKALQTLDIPVEMHIASAHRTPEKAMQLAKEAEPRGFGVIIAGAGMAAHLPGVLAAHTTLPVIGVPISGGALGGMDALYSIVQMPRGVPVATVAINGAYNAGILAAQIIAMGNPAIKEKLAALRQQMKSAVEDKDAQLQARGIKGGSDA